MPDPSKSRLKGRVALITGASYGIGAEVAFRFAQEGAHVIAVARSVDGLANLADRINTVDGSVSVEPFDLSDGSAIVDLGSRVAERWGRLDILVGNAATHDGNSPLEQISPEMWRRGFAVNVDANQQLICAFGPLLRMSDAGRAIFVTSRAAVLKLPSVALYSASKAALDAMVRSYAEEVAGTSVRVNLIDPGPVRTRMRARAMPGEDPNSLPAPDTLAGLFVDMALPSYTRNGKTVRALEIGLGRRLRQWASDVKHRRVG